MGAVNVKGVNFTKQENPKSTNIIDPGVWGGKVRVQIDNYTTSGCEANSTIKVAKLPVGATFLEMIVYHGALGTSVTMDIGDADVVDRYADGLDVAAAGIKMTRDANEGQGYKVLGVGATQGLDDTEIMLKILDANADDGIAIQTITFYTQE